MAERQIKVLEPDSTSVVTEQSGPDAIGNSPLGYELAKELVHGQRIDLRARNIADENSDLLDIYHDGTVRSENEINQERVKKYREQLTSQFLESIRESDFEFGYESVAEFFVRRRLSENALAIKEWLNELFIEHYDNFAVAAGVMRVIAHLDYEQIKPQGPTMALAALSHSSAEIKELGVRAFENWGTVESLSVLENIHVTEDWLSSYLANVIDDLRGNLKHGCAGS